MRELARYRRTVTAVAAFVATSAAMADSWQPAPNLNQARGFMASTADECGNLYTSGGQWRESSFPPYLALDSVEKLTWNGTTYAPTWANTSIVMPSPRVGHSLVCTNGFLYFIGGYTFTDPNNPIPITQVDRYDLTNNAWDQSPPPLPYATAGHACVVDKLGRIWVIGGGVLGTPGARDSVLVFDPARQQLGWQTMSTLNTARVFAGAVVDQAGRIWLIGGLDNGYQHHLNTVETIDSCSPAGWTVEAPRLPGPVSNSVEAALGADGYIYITGGWDGWYSPRVARIDPRNPSSTWEPRPPLNLARNEHNLVLGRDGRLYALAGEAVNVISQTSVESMYTGRCPGDLNNDREVNLIDLTLFLSTFGTICP